MKKTLMIGGLMAALAAVPATAPAKPGNGHGHGVSGQARSHGNSISGHARGVAPATSRRCARSQRVAYVARGGFVSFTPTPETTDGANAGTLVVDVQRSNQHGRNLRGQQTLTIADQRVVLSGVSDANGDGAVTLADAAAGDRVKLIGKVVRPRRGCTGQTSVQLRQVKVERPAPATTTPADPTTDPQG